MVLSSYAALLWAVASFTNAEIYTVTQWPSMCSAIYTSGASSVTIVQSTVTAISYPEFNDANINSGLVPFVIAIDQPTPYGYKRQAPRSHWLQANGYTTGDGSRAAQYYIRDLDLRTPDNQSYSTSMDHDNQTMAASKDVQTIDKTFRLTNGVLTWANPAFANGMASFYKTPAALQDNARVIAYFRGASSASDSWSPCALRARPVSEAVSASSSPIIYTAVSTSMIWSTNLQHSSGQPPFSYAPISLTASAIPPDMSSQSLTTSSASSMSNTMSLSTLTAPGTPIGPNHPSIYSYPSDSSSGTISTDSYSEMSSVAGSQSSLMPPDVYPSLSTSSLISSILVATAQTSSSLLPPTVYPSTAPTAQSSSSSLNMPSPSGPSSSASSMSTPTVQSSTSTPRISTPNAVSTTASSISLSSSSSPLLSTSLQIYLTSNTVSSSASSTSSSTSIFASSSSLIQVYAGLTSSSSAISSSSSKSTTSILQSSTTSSVSLPTIYASSSSTSTTRSTTSSSTRTATSTPTWSATSYVCPDTNGQTVQDNWGVSYIIGCSQDTTFGDFTSTRASNGWNDCFWFCHNSTSLGGTGKCTAFSYYGGTNGVGAGTCFLKDQGQEAFTPSTNDHIGAIQVAYLARSSSSASATSSSTVPAIYSASSSTTSISTTALRSSSALSSSASASSSSSQASTSSGYLVLARPTPCDFGDPAGTDQDDSYCEIDLPNSMRMYSRSSSATFASTNGFISLSNGSSQYQTSPLPYTAIPNSTVLPLMDDLFIYGAATPTQGIFYQINSTAVTYEYYLSTANSSSAIVHFTAGYTWAIPGVFTFTYYNVSNSGSTSSVGTQGLTSAGAQIATQYAYKTSAITAGMVLVCDTNANSCTRQ